MEQYKKGIWRYVVMILPFYLFTFLPLQTFAQVGEFRKDFAVGFNGGYVMSNVDFVPKVPQGYQEGMTAGMTVRYTCEKYFKSICAVVAEINYAQVGWKEDILDIQDQPVPLHTDPSQMLKYSRKMDYIQIPVFARLGWGRERKGFQAFFQVGPQFGMFLSEKTETNFNAHDPAFDPMSPEYKYAGKRASHVMAQDTMAIENKFEYGIAGGVGLEFSHRRVGHFMLEARYYYGLGNIYGNTKRDFFGRSNFSNIVFKFTYLFDIIRTKNSNIK